MFSRPGRFIPLLNGRVLGVLAISFESLEIAAVLRAPAAGSKVLLTAVIVVIAAIPDAHFGVTARTTTAHYAVDRDSSSTPLSTRPRPQEPLGSRHRSPLPLSVRH